MYRIITSPAGSRVSLNDRLSILALSCDMCRVDLFRLCVEGADDRTALVYLGGERRGLALQIYEAWLLTRLERSLGGESVGRTCH